MTEHLDPLSLIPQTAFRSKDASQFHSKLTFDERCAVLALVTAGVSRPLVALAFAINRRTVTHICNKESIHYRDVRKKMADLGVAEFKLQFVTEEAARRVAAVVPAPPPAPEHSEPVAAPGARPSIRANRSAGIQVVQPDQCAYTHRLEIAWREDADPIGWWYRDLDDRMAPQMWLHNGPESLMTSQACLKAAEINLLDD